MGRVKVLLEQETTGTKKSQLRVGSANTRVETDPSRYLAPETALLVLWALVKKSRFRPRQGSGSPANCDASGQLETPSTYRSALPSMRETADHIRPVRPPAYRSDGLFRLLSTHGSTTENIPRCRHQKKKKATSLKPPTCSCARTTHTREGHDRVHTCTHTQHAHTHTRTHNKQTHSRACARQGIWWRSRPLPPPTALSRRRTLR